ncbi:SusC/RagA family TonB-linked outer membrane protein [Flagellimonas myxillae]|uniref:SusC/RagA family TonB-linked outer membrane protein n=1 Tax=Flagellimonas myxillae TaxID=2942214 RepID=UPI00201F44E3|nr:SusC/RagA family TonB-linked outer membrane protein [Muricauda myxillae]MCL6265166.1 SusC/RagA family TonB-linked outer membrane protein [Muricauda myxillae]
MKKLMNSLARCSRIFPELDLKMKFSLLFFMVTLFQLQASSGYAQKTKIDLDVENVTISKIIEEIESKTEFKFFYSKEELDLERKVSIQVKKQEIQKVLRKLFPDGTIKYKIIDRQIVLTLNKSDVPKKEIPVNKVDIQETYVVSGTVTDEIGDPLPGVTVQIEGTNQGVITDFSGNYVLQADLDPGDYVFIFRSLGFTTQEVSVTFGSQTTIENNVVMATDILGLDQVVITGVGALTAKKQIGNTISSVEGTEIAQSGAVDISAALSGKLAGIQVSQNSGDPAGGISVRLRSASTVNGSSDPLYIIDGVIVNNNSTNVLNVTSVVQNRLSDINPQDIDRIEVIKGAAAAAIYGSRASNGVVQIFTKKGRSGKPVITVSTSANMNFLRKKRDFNQVPLDWTSSDITVLDTESVTRYDYQDMVFQNSMGTDNYVSISGGSENTDYFASISYLKNEGIMKSTDYEREGGRIRVNQKINDWASASAGMYFSTSHSNDVPNGGYGFGVLQTILFTNNTINPVPDENGNYPQMTFYPNILEYIETFDFQQENNRTISDLQINLSPTNDLKINYTLGYDNAESRGTRYVPIGTTTVPLGSASTTTISTKLLNSDLNASYNKMLSEDIKSTTTAGFSWQADENILRSISGTGLALGVRTTNGAASITTNENRSERTFWGGFLQQTFGYDNKLFLTGAIRLDGSSVFGADERNQFYPKASASYLMSEEDFWKDNLGDAINSFKLRAAWGQAGNLTAIGPFDRLSNYAAISIDGNSGLIAPTQLGNPDLKPERQTELEFGVDMALFDNRLGVELTYYSQDIEDLLLARTLSPSTGAGSRVENIGTMTNKGFEAMITATPVQTNNFNWSVTGTYSSNRNEVNNIAGEQFGIGNFGFSVAKNGQPLGVFYQGYYARNPDGSLLLTPAGLPQREKGSFDANGNPVPERDASGQPTGANLSKVIGDPNPDFIASVINELTYKDFSFRMQLDAVQGVDILSWDQRMFYRFGGGPATASELRGDQVRGTGSANFGIAESYIEDGSYIKLREISFSYLLREPFKGVDSFKFFLTGRNLFSIDNFSSYDPEVNIDAQSNGSRGGVMGLIPIPGVIKVGVTATF